MGSRCTIALLEHLLGTDIIALFLQAQQLKKYAQHVQQMLQTAAKAQESVDGATFAEAPKSACCLLM